MAVVRAEASAQRQAVHWPELRVEVTEDLVEAAHVTRGVGQNLHRLTVVRSARRRTAPTYAVNRMNWDDGLRFERLAQNETGISVNGIFQLIGDQEVVAQGQLVVEQGVVGV